VVVLIGADGMFAMIQNTSTPFGEGRMRRVARGVVVIGAAVVLGVVARADLISGQKPELAASGGWVKLPAPGEATTTAFAEVENATMYDVYLTSATADAAGKVEYRETGPGGVTKPEAPKFVTVPAYGSLSLEPKGVHLLLIDLKRPLKEGDMVSLTLTTDGGVALKVAAVVRKE
jgi:copper(I)-binding protein